MYSKTFVDFPSLLKPQWSICLSFFTAALPVFNHFYDDSNGLVTITVTASNLHGNETASKTIYIQNPVLEEHYRILPDTPASHPYPSPEQGKACL